MMLKTILLLTLALFSTTAKADTVFALVNTSLSIVQCCNGGSLLVAFSDPTILVGTNQYSVICLDPVFCGSAGLETGPLISADIATGEWTFAAGGQFNIHGSGIGAGSYPLPPGYHCIVTPLFPPGCLLPIDINLEGYFTGDVTVDMSNPQLPSLINGQVVFMVNPDLAAYVGLSGDTFKGSFTMFDGQTIQVAGATVPEPSALLLLATVALALRRKWNPLRF